MKVFVEIAAVLSVALVLTKADQTPQIPSFSAKDIASAIKGDSNEVLSDLTKAARNVGAFSISEVPQSLLFR